MHRLRVAPHGRGNLKLILAANPSANYIKLCEGVYSQTSPEGIPLFLTAFATDITLQAEIHFIFYLHLLRVTEVAMQYMLALQDGSHILFSK